MITDDFWTTNSRKDHIMSGFFASGIFPSLYKLPLYKVTYTTTQIFPSS